MNEMPEQSPEHDDLVRYIRENRERYTPEAMRAQLIAAGHALEDVDAAFRLLDAEQPIASALDLRRRAALLMVAAYVGTLLVFALFARPGVPWQILAGFLVVGALVSLLFIGTSGSLRRAQPERIASALAIGLAIPFVILVALAGLCIASTDPFGCGTEYFFLHGGACP